MPIEGEQEAVGVLDQIGVSDVVPREEGELGDGVIVEEETVEEWEDILALSVYLLDCFFDRHVL